MAQNRRPAKESGYEPMTITVPAEFRAALMAEAEAQGRTLSDVVRRRLLNPDPYSEIAGRASEAVSLIAAAEPDRGVSNAQVKLAMMREALVAAFEALGAGDVKLTEDELSASRGMGSSIGTGLRHAKRGPFVELYRRLMSWDGLE